MGRARVDLCRRCEAYPVRRGRGTACCVECGPVRSQVGVCYWCLGPTKGRARYCSYRCDMVAWRARAKLGEWPGMLCEKSRHFVDVPGSRVVSNAKQGQQCALCFIEARRRTSQRKQWREGASACLCGCGSPTKARSGYRFQHAPPPELPEPPPLCLCGCGLRTRARNGYAHYVKTLDRPTIPCLCGCGTKTYAASGFFRDHWRVAGVPRPGSERPRSERELEQRRVSNARKNARERAQAVALREVLLRLGVPYPQGLTKSQRAAMYRQIRDSA